MAASTGHSIGCDRPPDDDDGRSPHDARRCLGPAKRLRAVSDASWQAALGPLLASDDGRAYPGCARRLGVQHEAVRVSAGAQELSHPSGELSAPTVESVPRAVPQGRDSVLGQLLALVSVGRIGARSVPVQLLRGLNGTAMHTFR